MSASSADDGADGRYASVTPAGCYHVVEGGAPTAAREALTARCCAPPRRRRSTRSDGGVASELRGLVDAGLVALREEVERLPSGTIAELLPSVLPALSERGRVVLTESGQGFFLDYVGVGREEAEEIAVLASGLRATADRSSVLLGDALDVHSRAFAVVDPAGNSEIGFWPLRIGDNEFTLTILGIPRFNSPQFRLLVWALVERYGQDGAERRPDPTGVDPRRRSARRLTAPSGYPPASPVP